MTHLSRPARWQVLLAFAAILSFAGPGRAQIASSNTATADPSVPRPHTTPCAVQLFSNVQFADFSPKPFTFTPPAACPGPWAKVVLEADFSCTAGRQFDRTAQMAIGHVNVYYGTTMEPSGAVSPSWHVERDLTDYSALFRTSQTGETNLGNLVNSTFTGILSGSANCCSIPRPSLSRRRARPMPSSPCPTHRAAPPCSRRPRTSSLPPSRCRPTSKPPIST